MDWLQIGTSLARIGAPMLASLFLGPEAGNLTTTVLNKLASKFGVAATPDAVQAAINTDPDAASKVASIEAEHSDTIQAYLQDVQSARATQVQLVQAGSPLAYGSTVISVIVTIGFFGLLTLLLYAKLDDTSTRVAAIINVILGTLAAAFTQVVNYHLGSTANSKSRMDELATIAKAAVGVPVQKRR